MKADIWMPLYTGDYLRGTTMLGRAEHGSYLLLIMAYWDNRGPLVADDDETLREIAKCPKEEWARTRKLMLAFFEEKRGKWHHTRLDRELAEAEARKSKSIEKIRRMNAAKNGIRLGSSGGSEGRFMGALNAGASDAELDEITDGSVRNQAKEPFQAGEEECPI